MRINEISVTNMAAANLQVLPANAHRVGLYVSTPSTGTAIAISFRRVLPSFNDGLCIRSDNSPVFFSIENIGDDIKNPVNLFPSGAAANVTLWDIVE